MSIESMKPSNHLILCHPLLLPSIFPSIRVLPNESAPLIRWPNCFKNSCVSSHRIKRNTRLTKRSLSHLVNRPARSLKKNKKQPVFHVLISQTMVPLSCILKCMPRHVSMTPVYKLAQIKDTTGFQGSLGNDYGSQGKK